MKGALSLWSCLEAESDVIVQFFETMLGADGRIGKARGRFLLDVFKQPPNQLWVPFHGLPL